MQAMASTQLLRFFRKILNYCHSCVYFPSEQQQAHSEEIPWAPADKDRVWRRDHPRAVSQRSADVGRRPAGRAAHHHVLHWQNRQVPAGYTWQRCWHVAARCHRGLWWLWEAASRCWEALQKQRPPLYAKAEHINRRECKEGIFPNSLWVVSCLLQCDKNIKLSLQGFLPIEFRCANKIHPLYCSWIIYHKTCKPTIIQINLACLHPKATRNISTILNVIDELLCHSPLCGFLLCPVNTEYIYVE